MPSSGYRFGSVWRPPHTVGWLAFLLPVLAIVAFQGGYVMVTDPLGPMEMTVEMLKRAPVDTFFWPGVFLLCLSAASLLATVGIVFGWHWHWAYRIEARLGYRWPWVASLSIGVTLLVLEIVEVYLIPFHPVLHPLLIVWSVGIILLTCAPSTMNHLRAPRFVGKPGPAREHLPYPVPDLDIDL